MRSARVRSSGSSDETNSTASPFGRVHQSDYRSPFGVDINAAGGFVEQKHLGFGGEPFAEDHLLLVAAAEVTDELVGARVF
jgi:hypothetical protein